MGFSNKIFPLNLDMCTIVWKNKIRSKTVNLISKSRSELKQKKKKIGQVYALVKVNIRKDHPYFSTSNIMIL